MRADLEVRILAAAQEPLPVRGVETSVNFVTAFAVLLGRSAAGMLGGDAVMSLAGVVGVSPVDSCRRCCTGGELPFILHLHFR
jgi:hypothetical protein